MFIIAAIVIWLTIDFTLGRKKHYKKLKHNDYPFRESHFSPFAKGPELFTDLFSELKKAKQHIHIQFYIVKDDEISREFLGILKKKAREGVEVRLLLDWLGSFPIKKKIVQDLKKHGIEFSFSQKLKLPFLFYSLQTRNHRKITVIDGKIGYIGGFNIGKEYIDLDSKLSPWRDYHLKVTGEGVADLQLHFLANWDEELKINLLNEAVYFPVQQKGPSKHKIIPSKGPFLENTFSSLICHAKKSIIIGTPYFIPSPALLGELQSALRRGVKLTIIVPKTADHLLVKEASYRYLRILIQDGARVYQFLNGFYHAKIIIIDDEICDVGTANFDRRSLFLNYEINCYIYDRPFVNQMLAIVQKDILDSKSLTLSELNRPNFIRSCKEFVARLAAPLL